MVVAGNPGWAICGRGGRGRLGVTASWVGGGLACAALVGLALLVPALRRPGGQPLTTAPPLGCSTWPVM
jgi:hypothetical protein